MPTTARPARAAKKPAAPKRAAKQSAAPKRAAKKPTSRSRPGAPSTPPRVEAAADPQLKNRSAEALARFDRARGDELSGWDDTYEALGEILQIAGQLFADRAWDAAPFPKYPDTLVLPFDTGRARWKSYAQAKNADRLFVFYSVSLDNVPPDRRIAASEYLARVNWGLLVGNFEIDLGDGEVRFKTSVDFRDERPAASVIAGVVEANLDAINRYLPGLFAVVRGEMTPEAAFADAEE